MSNALPGLVIMVLATIGAVRVLRVAWLASKTMIASFGRGLQVVATAMANIKPTKGTP